MNLKPHVFKYVSRPSKAIVTICMVKVKCCQIWDCGVKWFRQKRLNQLAIAHGRAHATAVRTRENNLH